jgi:hypothetical protein
MHRSIHVRARTFFAFAVMMIGVGLKVPFDVYVGVDQAACASLAIFV